MPNRRSTPRPARHRRGITLVEVMVALVLVATGLLGIAGSSALLLRRTATHADARRAVRLATARVAYLTAAGCAGARDGVAEHRAGRMSERWSLLPATGPARLLQVEVRWPGRAAPESLLVRSAILC